MATDPTAVTIQESSEIAPTRAMLAGNMMMPDPIMLTATRNVSCISVIFLFCVVMALSVGADDSFLHDVGVERGPAVDPFLVHALDLVVETGKSIERLLEGQEVIEHGLCAGIPSLALHHDADAWGIDERERGGDASLDAIERHVVHVVCHELFVGVFWRHREPWKALRTEA